MARKRRGPSGPRPLHVLPWRDVPPSRDRRGGPPALALHVERDLPILHAHRHAVPVGEASFEDPHGERVLDLPDAVEEAFSASDAVYTEIPMNLAAQIKVSAALLLEDDGTLEDLLPEPLYRRAAAYVESKGRRMDLFHRFRIWSFMINLMLLDDFQKYIASVAMDNAFYLEAERHGKEVGGLETVEEQRPLLSLRWSWERF